MEVKSRTQKEGNALKVVFYTVDNKKTTAMCHIKVDGNEAWLDTASANKTLSPITRVRHLNKLMDKVEDYLRTNKLTMHGETNPAFARYLVRRKGYSSAPLKYVPGMKPKLKMHFRP